MVSQSVMLMGLDGPYIGSMSHGKPGAWKKLTTEMFGASKCLNTIFWGGSTALGL